MFISQRSFSPLACIAFFTISIAPASSFLSSTTATGALPTTSSSLSSSLSFRRRTTTTTQQYALTERQLQFWEDVEDGLDDIEAVYNKQNNGQDSSIDRIRQFSKSARGEIPPPTPSGPKHQPSEEHVEGLTAKPFWNTNDNPDLFPWAQPLEENAHVIQQEFNDKLLQKNSNDQNPFSSDSAWQNQVMGEGWSAIRLQRLGAWNMDNIREFPKTYELLRDLNIPLAVRGVCFARQAPGSGVQPHTDGRNFILTSHLGLQVPEGCWIKVGEETQTWQEGKLTTLDTSFEHSTGNPTDSERHVLIIDFWHPELTEAERAALEFVYDLRNKFESGKVPVRKPRSLMVAQGESEGGGLGALWNSITGGR